MTATGSTAPSLIRCSARAGGSVRCGSRRPASAASTSRSSGWQWRCSLVSSAHTKDPRQRTRTPGTSASQRRYSCRTWRCSGVLPSGTSPPLGPPTQAKESPVTPEAGSDLSTRTTSAPARADSYATAAPTIPPPPPRPSTAPPAPTRARLGDASASRAASASNHSYSTSPPARIRSRKRGNRRRSASAARAGNALVSSVPMSRAICSMWLTLATKPDSSSLTTPGGTSAGVRAPLRTGTPVSSLRTCCRPPGHRTYAQRSARRRPLSRKLLFLPGPGAMVVLVTLAAAHPLAGKLHGLTLHAVRPAADPLRADELVAERTNSEPFSRSLSAAAPVGGPACRCEVARRKNAGHLLVGPCPG